MKYNPEKHHRCSIRLRGYDYSQPGLYFITICVQDRRCLFGEIENGEMICNEYGKIAHKEWENTEQVRDNCRMHEFIVMPNHIHGIIEIIHTDNRRGEGRGESQFAPTTPTAPTKIWQRNYYEHIIRNEKSYQKISEYIITNPQNWDIDKLKK